MGVVGALIGGALLGGLFGGGGRSSSPQPAAQAPVVQTPAAQAAPAADSATAGESESTKGTDLQKKRRGKKGLLVNPLDKKASGGGVGTGLNI